VASALIYLVIIGMWVAYFIPKWISHRDQVTGKSADRYKSAIKMVSENFSVTPEKPDKTIKEKQLRIRRIAFLVLVATFIVSTALAITAATSVLIELIPLSGFTIYLVSVRRQKVANQLRERRLKVITQITQATVAQNQEYVFDNERIESYGIKEEVEINSHWVPIRETADPAGVTVVPHGSSIIQNEDSPSWQPIQVPTPTYLIAPKAVTPKRTIDLTVPGAWSKDKEVELYLEEQSIMPEREDGFAQDLKQQTARNHDQAAGQ
jgi:hypothetical protein